MVISFRLLALSAFFSCGLFLSATAAPIALTTTNVQIVQLRLEALGYMTGGDNGVMGQATRNAIANFQRDFNLYANGELDEVTYSRLVGAAYRPHVPDGYVYMGPMPLLPVPANQRYAAPVPANPVTVTPIAGASYQVTNGVYYNEPRYEIPGVTEPYFKGRNFP